MLVAIVCVCEGMYRLVAIVCEGGVYVSSGIELQC